MNADGRTAQRAGDSGGLCGQQRLGQRVFRDGLRECACGGVGSRGVDVQRQRPFEIRYRGERVGHYVADMVVEDQLIIEVKALSRLAPEHEAQLLNYLKASGLTIGLLLNFGKPKVEIKRLVRGHSE